MNNLIKHLCGKINNIVSACIRFCIATVAQYLPIKKNTIIFASYPDFSDNSWAVYKYLKENRSDLELYWIMKGNRKPKEVTDKEILKTNLKNYIFFYWTICRAGFIMGTHKCYGDRFNRRGKTIINLNHGGCPIKGEKRNLTVRRYGKKTYDYALCRGTDAIFPSSNWLCCDPKIVLPLGMARDDIFCRNIGPGNKNPFYNGHSSKLIVWMPTFRKSINPDFSENRSATSTGLPLMQTNEDVFALDRFLKLIDIQLIIKIHPLQEDNELFKEQFTNISIITNRDLDKINRQTYEVIGYSDALITDYSSVYFDYLITEKPVAFILDDYEQYKEDRGFVFDDPKEIMAGKHIYNLNQLKDFLTDIKNESDSFKEKRLLMKEKFVGKNPEYTSKRIIEYFNI